MGSGIFALSTRAMYANQSMLDTIAHNISNANTPGYSRQSVELATDGGMYTGAGFFGRGVTVNTVSRSTNNFLIANAQSATAGASSDKARMDKLEQLEKTLPTGETGLGFASSQLLNAFVDVANQPQDMSARQVVLSRADEWASRVNSSAQQIESLQEGVLSDMGTDIAQANTYTTKIADLNQKIASFKGSGHEPNDLLDQRDQVIKDLNKIIKVTTVAADDGSLSVFMGGGQILVLGNQAQQLALMQSASPDYSTVTVGGLGIVTSNGTPRALDDSQITGGSLQGMMRFQNEDLAKTRKDLNQYVQSFADRINTQQGLGVLGKLDASGNTITGSALFSNTGSALTVGVVLTNPQDIAASSPLLGFSSDSNTGTLSVAGLNMTPPSGKAIPTPPLTLAFTSSVAGTYGYTITDAGGGVSAGTWTPGQPLAYTTPAGDALFTLDLTGVPNVGDTATIEPPKDPSGNNGNARSMLNLRDEKFITLSSTGMASSVNDAYSQMIGNLGVQVQSGKTAANISQTLQDNADQTLASVAGVNLDEEAARLLQFQQSYQASAKVMQVAQKIFDTLLSTAA